MKIYISDSVFFIMSFPVTVLAGQLTMLTLGECILNRNLLTVKAKAYGTATAVVRIVPTVSVKFTVQYQRILVSGALQPKGMENPIA